MSFMHAAIQDWPYYIWPLDAAVEAIAGDFAVAPQVPASGCGKHQTGSTQARGQCMLLCTICVPMLMNLFILALPYFFMSMESPTFTCITVKVYVWKLYVLCVFIWELEIPCCMYVCRLMCISAISELSSKCVKKPLVKPWPGRCQENLWEKKSWFFMLGMLKLFITVSQ